MPGSVKTTLDSGSLQSYPFTKFAAYGMPYARKAAVSEYKDGFTGRSLEANANKRRWRLAQRLSGAELQMLWAFYKTHLVQPFNFADRINDMECRAVFTGTFQESPGPGYFSVSVELSEVV